MKTLKSVVIATILAITIFTATAIASHNSVELKRRVLSSSIQLYFFDTTRAGIDKIQFSNVVRKLNSFYRLCDYSYTADREVGDRIAEELFTVVFKRKWGFTVRQQYNADAIPEIRELCSSYTLHELYNGFISNMAKFKCDSANNGTRSLNATRAMFMYRIIEEVRNRAIGAPEKVDTDIWLE